MRWTDRVGMGLLCALALLCLSLTAVAFFAQSVPPATEWDNDGHNSSCTPKNGCSSAVCDYYRQQNADSCGSGCFCCGCVMQQVPRARQHMVNGGCTHSADCYCGDAIVGATTYVYVNSAIDVPDCG